MLRWTPARRRPALVTLLLTFAGCARQDQQIQQHNDAFASLAETAAALGDAWLGGAVSGTYTMTAFDRTRRLVEQERTSLAAASSMLADPRGASLSQDAERLSRLLALLVQDVRDADADRARGHLAALPLRRHR